MCLKLMTYPGYSVEVGVAAGVGILHGVCLKLMT